MEFRKTRDLEDCHYTAGYRNGKSENANTGNVEATWVTEFTKRTHTTIKITERKSPLTKSLTHTNSARVILADSCCSDITAARDTERRTIHVWVNEVDARVARRNADAALQAQEARVHAHRDELVAANPTKYADV